MSGVSTPVGSGHNTPPRVESPRVETKKEKKRREEAKNKLNDALNRIKSEQNSAGGSSKIPLKERKIERKTTTSSDASEGSSRGSSKKGGRIDLKDLISYVKTKKKEEVEEEELSSGEEDVSVKEESESKESSGVILLNPLTKIRDLDSLTGIAFGQLPSILNRMLDGKKAVKSLQPLANLLFTKEVAQEFMKHPEHVLSNSFLNLINCLGEALVDLREDKKFLELAKGYENKGEALTKIFEEALRLEDYSVLNKLLSTQDEKGERIFRCNSYENLSNTLSSFLILNILYLGAVAKKDKNEKVSLKAMIGILLNKKFSEKLFNNPYGVLNAITAPIFNKELKPEEEGIGVKVVTTSVEDHSDDGQQVGVDAPKGSESSSSSDEVSSGESEEASSSSSDSEKKVDKKKKSKKSSKSKKKEGSKSSSKSSKKIRKAKLVGKKKK